MTTITSLEELLVLEKKGKIIVNDDCRIVGHLYGALPNLIVGGNLWVRDDLIALGGLAVGDNLIAKSGELTALGDLTVGRDLIVKSGDLTAGRDLIVKGGNLTVKSGDLTVGRDLTVKSGDLTVKSGDLTAGRDLTVRRGDLIALGNLAVEGKLWVGGDWYWSQMSLPNVAGTMKHHRVLPAPWQRSYWADRLGVSIPVNCYYDAIIAGLDIPKLLRLRKWTPTERWILKSLQS